MEFTLLDTAENSSPYSVACGENGDVCFTENKGNHIGVIRHGGMKRYPIPTPEAGASVIAMQDETAWFTLHHAGKLGCLTTDGIVTEIDLPAGCRPFGITTDRKGAIWFTCMSSHRIGRYHKGELDFLHIPTPECYPSFITCADDGSLWFCENQGNKIGRIGKGGVITEYALPKPGSAPVGIAPCGDGAVFVELMGGRIGVIAPNGKIREHPIPTPDAKPHAVTRAPDGGYWISLWGSNKIARFALDGEVREHEIPVPAAEPHGVATDRQGYLWVALENAGIGRFQPSEKE